MKNSDKQKIEAMSRGGQVLASVKTELAELTKPGISFAQIEEAATAKILAAGMKPSFSTVPGYDYTTCVMKNDALCHGLPTSDQIVEDGDLITIDVGLLSDGYHLDTSISFGVGHISGQVERFLSVGKQALRRAIAEARVGQSVFSISKAMQKVVEKAGYGAVYQLTGHGIGRQLHQDPSIPCVAYEADQAIKLTLNQTLAIEIMYTLGNPKLILDKDGWTYRTADGSLSAMFEETVLITTAKPQVLTST